MWNLRSRFRRWRTGVSLIDPNHWHDTLATSRYAERLPQEDQTKLHSLVGQFLADKIFAGAHGLAVTETMRVRIALHACLPILHLGLGYYRNWRGIIVYPGDFRVRRAYEDQTGVVHEGMEELCGESLTHGPMVLSWEAMLNEAEAPDLDLVIHESAHKLDVLNGEADGFPPLHDDMPREDWTRDWKAAYADFCKIVEAGEETRIDAYAASDPAEFFAVMSETFFTTPRWIREDYPGVYAQLAAFYRQDTATLLTDA